ncbi:MAG TPA: FCD domain-containing protein [Pseudonocardia sp.]|jgi:DNA-binding GntR family transcriptional regulator
MDRFEAAEPAGAGPWLVHSGLGIAPQPPADTADLSGLYRLRVLIEVELAAEAAQLLTGGQLDWLRRRIDLFCTPRTSIPRTIELSRAFGVGLLAPAMTVCDHRALVPMWAEIDRQMVEGLSAHNRRLGELPGFAEVHHRLIDAYRTQDRDTVRAAMREHLERGERTLHELRALPVERARQPR